MRNTPRLIPPPVKIVYSLFVAVMVPIYWRLWGPQNFLYFCDVAVLVTFIGMWLESPLLIGIEAVAILLPQTIWIVDFGARLCGFHLLGMTDYMFDTSRPAYLRGISLFHGWLPVLVVWLLTRVGYDRRSFKIQVVIGVLLLLACYFFFNPPVPGKTISRGFNINYVFGMDETRGQVKYPPLVWLAIMTFGIPTLIYLPTHLVLRRVFREPGFDATKKGIIHE